MKKIGTIIMLLISLSLFGCANVKNTDTDKTTENDLISTIVSGEFSVGVRNVIPDYCFDDTTPRVAIVTEFQSYPFTIFVGEEIGAQLKENNAYVFSIDPIEVAYSKEELQNMNLSTLVWELNGFKIKGFRLAEENELGLESLRLTFTEKVK